MIDFTHPCLTLPLISVIGVITSLAGIAVIEGIMKKEETDEKVHFLATAWGLLLLSGMVILACGAVFFGAEEYWETPEAAGQAGDMFGGLTALFSGLAFAGLIAALFTQRQELITQRKELTLQRKELEQTRNVFQRQKFESTYFHLLKLFRDYAETTSCQRGDFSNRCAVNTRRDVFTGQALLRELAAESVQGKFPREADLDKFEGKTLREFKAWYDECGDFFLGPYFRLLWNCVRLVDEQKTHDMNDKEKLGFVRYLRSTLSPAEVKLLALYGLSEVGRKVGDENIARYQLIKYLKTKDVEGYPFLVTSYDPEAFGDRYDTVEDAMRRSTSRNSDRE
ncbi:putative phage abortive infection protein [Halocynthiibacter styelae]|uniref:Phage abortive infection protein n=1 Tax=Halocynthiibacter styelae TaxID=2761955 RepID=A0A8J7IC96_9RHOB|nr:putative phage abortive infection protein [Paenihalocynthiibacter styelae]MBI1493063.1 hypothetical protein [Paenihalocynthiibacter styelae]